MLTHFSNFYKFGGEFDFSKLHGHRGPDSGILSEIKIRLEQGRHPAFEIFALILIFLSNLAVLLGLILFKVSEIRILTLIDKSRILKS